MEFPTVSVDQFRALPKVEQEKYIAAVIEIRMPKKRGAR